VSILARAFQRPQNLAPVPYAPRGFGTGGSGLFSFGKGKAGPTEQQLQAVMSSGTLFAIIDALSTAVSAVDWDLYRVAASGRKDEDEERESVTGHAALDLWQRWNPFMTGSFGRELVQQHIDLTGEGAIIVAKQGSLPIELWPVRPDKLSPVPHPKKFLAGWIYTDPDGQKIPFRVDEVLHIRKPSAIDPYRGASAVDAIGVDLEAADFAAQWNRNFFLNSAEPGGVVEVEHRLSDDQFDEMVMRWNEQHKGVQRAHRVAILEAAKYVPRAFSQRDMQFSELRDASRDVIMEAFRVSKTSLGITDDVNRAAALASEYQFSSKLTVPRCNRWRDCLNYQLLPMYGSTGKGVEFDYESPVTADVESDALDRTSKVNAAVAIMGIPGVKFDVNEVFNAYGLPEIDYEEVALPLPGQNFGPDGEVLPPEEQSPPGQQPGGQPPAKKGEEKPQQGPKNALIRAEGAPDVDLQPLQAAWTRELNRLLDQWDDVRAGWRTQLRRQIVAAVEVGDLPALARLELDSDQAARLLREALARMAHAAAQCVVDEADAQGVAMHVPAASVLRASTAGDAAAEAVDETTDVAATIAALMAAAEALTAGVEAIRVTVPGVTAPAQVASEVINTLEERGDQRERDQLGGALTGAQNRARLATFKAGPVGSLYADETLDGNTCAPCREIHGRFIATTDDLSAVDKLYTAMGGYVDCLGRARCRGTITGAWRPKQSPAGPISIKGPQALDWEEALHPRDPDGKFRGGGGGIDVPEQLSGAERRELRADWERSVGDLSAQEQNALHRYAGMTGFMYMNDMMRGGKLADSLPPDAREDLEQEIEALDALFNDYELPKAVTVRRFVGDGVVPDDVGPGDVLDPLGYNSTTLAPEAGGAFNHLPNVMEIVVPKGMNAMMGNSRENELILPNGTMFEVLKVEQRGDQKWLTMLASPSPS
jgi:HK97 family phage portal protein